MNKSLLIPVFFAFGAFTVAADWHDGLAGIFAAIVRSYGSMQIVADMVIALSVVMVWMWQSARHTGTNIWPWVVATSGAGSFGPLPYFITSKEKA